jgi:galactokinase
LTADRFSHLLRALPRAESHSQPFGWFVPGRIEVLGKHTDYAGGRSLVCAIERGIRIVAQARDDDRVRIADAQCKTPFDSLLQGIHSATTDDWFVYPSTVLRRMTRNFPAATRGFDAVFDSDLPSAGGLSSSSALMIAVALVFAAVNRLDTTEVWREALATREALAGYAASIENGQTFGRLDGERGVGTSGGSEDHVAILCGGADTVLQYAFNPIQCEGNVPFPAHLTFAVAVSGVVARKTGNAMAQYNRAAKLARRALEHWNMRTLRTDRSLASAVRSRGVREVHELLGRVEDPEFTASELQERIEQFAEESEILVPAGSHQLRSGDMVSFGQTAARSQQLAERMLRNHVPETSALVASALDIGATAASAFGAGFGGSVWALVERGGAADFLQRWKSGYGRAFPGRIASSMFFLTRPARGALEATL